MKISLNEIRSGMATSSNEEVIKAARQYMKDNDFKLTPEAKLIAIGQLEDISDDGSYPPDMLLAVAVAIVGLSEEPALKD